MKTKKVMILAAGYGTRMEEYTKELPKPLLPIRTFPLIDFPLFLSYIWKVNYAVINVHYKKQKLKQYLKNFPYFPIYFSEEKHLLGTAGGVAYAIQQNLLDDYFVLLNSDTIFFPDFNPYEYIAPMSQYGWNHLLFFQPKSEQNQNEQGFLLKKKFFDPIYEFSFSPSSKNKNEYFYTGFAIFHISFFHYYNFNIPSHQKKKEEIITKIFKKELKALLGSSIYGTIYRGIRYDSGTKKQYENLQYQFSIPKPYQKQWDQFIQGWKV